MEKRKLTTTEIRSIERQPQKELEANFSYDDREAYDEAITKLSDFGNYVLKTDEKTFAQVVRRADTKVIYLTSNRKEINRLVQIAQIGQTE